MPLAPGVRLGPYEIVSQLGVGGMGEVYRARDSRLDRSVAVKILPARLAADPQFRDRFDREARTISRLNHAHICTVHDVGHQELASGESPTAYIVMEYVEGETLSLWMRRTPRPSVDAVVDIALQVAGALVAAHASGVVHRDIKPENVIVRSDGSVKVLDFGIAKLAESSPAVDVLTVAGETGVGQVVGTTKYMSPEQARGLPVDARTDLFSFGVLLYEMLSGTAPFEAATAADTIVAILHRQPPPVSQTRPDTSQELQRVVERCLEKDLTRRWPSARDLVVGLEEVAADAQPKTTKSAASIAVLPFVNMSADPENEYFCDGLAEDLISALTKMEQLRVAARTSAFSFKGKQPDLKDVGRTLNVNAVLEGSVRKSGNRLRVTAQLVNVKDGYQISSERYDRQLDDIFAIQDEISLAIVSALKVRLLGEEKAALVKRQTASVEAYQLYMRGRHHWHAWSPDGLNKAAEYMERAIAIDPEYALAYVGLADAYVAFGTVNARPYSEILPKAHEQLTRALAIDPDLDMAWTLSSVVHFHEWEWRAAEHSVARALALNPRLGHAHSADACLHLFQGRFDQALGPAKRSLELDPLAPQWNYLLSHVQIGRNDLVAARRAAEATLEFAPDAWTAHHVCGMLDVAVGEFDRAVRTFEDAVRCSGGSPTAVGALSCALAMSGQRDRAERELSGLLSPPAGGIVSPLNIAIAHCGLGRVDSVFEWLERSLAERDIWLRWAFWNPLLASVRQDPRMLDLVRRMGLSPQP